MKFENSNQLYRLKSYSYVIFIFLFSACLSCTTLGTSRSSEEKIKDYEVSNSVVVEFKFDKELIKEFSNFCINSHGFKIL